MKLGLMLPMFSDAAAVRAAADRAERLGFDGVFAFDHLFPPGRGPSGPSLEVFTTLAAVATQTERVALGSLVSRVGVRSAGLLAKSAAQIDDLSGGRMILGLGSGDSWDDPEARAFDLPTREDQDERRAQLGDTARAIKALFDGEPWEGSSLVPAMQGPLAPAPRRPGGPPVWLGGTADEMVRLAAETADAWNGWGLSLEGFTRRAGSLAQLASAAGRSVEATWAQIVLVGRDEEELAGLRLARSEAGSPDAPWSGTSEAFAAHLVALEAAGATWAIVLIAGPADRAEVIAEAAASALSAGA